MIRAKCPKCATPLSLPDAAAGNVRACPECDAKFRVPGPKPAAPLPADPVDDDEEEEVAVRVVRKGPPRQAVPVDDDEDEVAPAAPRRARPVADADEDEGPAEDDVADADWGDDEDE